MKENERGSVINPALIIRKLLDKKWVFLKVWVITFLLSCLWILPQPRTYTCSVSVAPESESNSIGGLSSLASSFGINVGSAGSDAIYPQLYPDLFSSTEFLTGLCDIKIITKDGKVDASYYDYLDKYQKNNPYTYPIEYLIKKNEADEEVMDSDGRRFDPFRLSQKTTRILKIIKKKVKCTHSKMTDIVTITVEDQDPLVCALLADSVRVHLQNHIIEYRTKKANSDYLHYQTLTDNARADYEEAMSEYAAFCEGHTNVILPQNKLKQRDLEKKMEMTYSIYTALYSRLEAAEAKVQDATPVFTTLKNATVPVKPSAPKRMIFVAVMLVLSTMVTTGWLFRRELAEWF